MRPLRWVVNLIMTAQEVADTGTCRGKKNNSLRCRIAATALRLDVYNTFILIGMYISHLYTDYTPIVDVFGGYFSWVMFFPVFVFPCFSWFLYKEASKEGISSCISSMQIPFKTVENAMQPPYKNTMGASAPLSSFVSLWATAAQIWDTDVARQNQQNVEETIQKGWLLWNRQTKNMEKWWNVGTPENNARPDKQCLPFDETIKRNPIWCKIKKLQSA